MTLVGWRRLTQLALPSCLWLTDITHPGTLLQAFFWLANPTHADSIMEKKKKKKAHFSADQHGIWVKATELDAHHALN